MKGSQRKYLDHIRKVAGKAINSYTLIEPDDNILVALSGGKDSLVLLDILSSRLRFIPINYTLHAAYVNVEIISPNADMSYLSSFCRDLNVPFHHKTITLDRHPGSKKSSCFVCSWNRRKELFLMADALGCTKIAFGHHLDDIVETLIMNMTLHGKFSTMPVKLSMFNGALFIIRPLALLTGEEINRYAQLKQFKHLENRCEFGDTSKREEAKKIIREMERIHRKAKWNIFHSMSNINTEYLV